jgi:tricorn protease
MRYFLCLMALVTVAVAEPRAGYYRYPSIHEKTIVFTAEGDLWIVPIEGGAARRLTSHPGQETNAAISPDGKTVAFTAEYEGPAEVYTISIDGGMPARRTWEGGRALVAGWTRDGRILYSANRYSTLPNTKLVALSLDGKQEVLPLWQACEGDFDARGEALFFTRFSFQGSSTKRYQGGTAQNIWRFSPGSEAVPLTKDYPGTSARPMFWNGRVYFASDRDGTMNIWSMNPDGKDLRQHTKHRGWDIQSPSQNDGRIVYQYGADLWMLDLRSGKTAVIPITLVSDFDNLRERWVRRPIEYLTTASLSPDGEAVVFTARGMLFVAPSKPGRLVTVAAKPGVRYRNALFMPDGKSILALSSESGELEFWKFPASGIGSPERLTTDGKILRWDGRPSPDGNWIAHRDKDQRLWLYDTRSKSNKLIVQSMNDDLDHLSWSPDSRWLAYVESADNTFNQIKLYNVEDGTITTATSDRYNSGYPAWSADGKWLYFLSDRNLRSSVQAPWGPRQPDPYFDRSMKILALSLKKGLRAPFEPPDELSTEAARAPETPKVNEAPKGDAAKNELPKPEAVKVEIERDGLITRLYELPVPAGNYAGLAVTNKRLLWLDRDSSGDFPPKVALKAVEITHKIEVETVIGEINGFELSQNGKKMLVRRGEEFYVFDSDAKGAALTVPKALTEARVNLSEWSFPLKPRDEFRELFIDAWRMERDYFYDRKMHGVDWIAMREKYFPLVDRVTDRQELNDVIAQLMGELSALHTFVVGGDVRRGTDQVQMGSLGALLERDPQAGGYRVKHIYKNDPDLPDQQSPLAKLGVDVAEGDVITQINGVDTMSESDIGALLRDKAGKQLLLRVVNSAGAKRDCIVKPISMAQESGLRYSEWEYTRRLAVEEAGKGQIGYLHLRAMGSNDISQWVREYYPVFNRQGLIIDVRHNGGGNIDSWILGKLLRKAWFYWQPRVGNPYWNMQYAFRGHMVVLVDENTASDGEAFAEGFRRLGLGKVIGSRTWGGEIWLSASNQLADRGIATASEIGVYSPEGQWLIEGHGVDPDIVVDNPPHATFNGHDAQLEAAIKHLEELIKKNPRPTPKAPDHPDKSFKY